MLYAVMSPFVLNVGKKYYSTHLQKMLVLHQASHKSNFAEGNCDVIAHSLQLTAIYHSAALMQYTNQLDIDFDSCFLFFHVVECLDHHHNLCKDKHQQG